MVAGVPVSGPSKERLARFLSAVEDMATGDLEGRAPISDRADELDAIGYAINVVFGELAFATRELQQAKEKAEQANREKSEFLRNAAHELRTPLAAVQSYADLLLARDFAEQDRELVSRLHANARALGDLIDDLLDLSRLEAQKLDVARADVAIRKLVADVVEALAPRAAEKGVSMLHIVDSDVPEKLRCDGRRLRQILMNVVGNAVKFTEDGPVRILVSGSDDHAHLFIDVEDTGVGIGDGERERLFEPFSQANPDVNVRFGGSGLGLALSKRLAQLMGGDLTLLKSELGIGSTFRIAIAPPATTTTELHAAEPRDGSGASLQGMRILLAEDSPDVYRPLRKLLELSGGSVEVVTDGETAVTRGHEGDFDLILMDVRMPRLDGLSATAKLRALGEDVPILALTALASAEDHQRCMDAGCNDHVQKPIAYPALEARLARYRRS